jgi:hypothetical protein
VSHEHLPYYLDEFTFRFNPEGAKGNRWKCRLLGFEFLQADDIRLCPREPGHQTLRSSRFSPDLDSRSVVLEVSRFAALVLEYWVRRL